jgi:predicted polyphosphate/ATP-dependent NAD kinase
MKIGFLINPIAGLGGAVGLKGTDGDAYKKALELGAKPVSTERARIALEGVPKDNAKFYTCSGVMGENLLKELEFNYEVVYEAKETTTSGDTRNACRAFLSKEIDLILFSGGDGTARDVTSVVGKEIPILGIPAGVKMNSSVFVVTPKIAGELLSNFREIEIAEGEILDINEEAYRRGVFDVRLFGYALTLRAPFKIQGRKNIFHGLREEESKEEIARFALEFMDKETTYILGPGTTIKKICDLMGARKTLLGVDVLKNRRVLVEDANEEKLLELLETNPKATIMVSPIGSQGFIFGRGNQQISSRVIRKVGVENIMVLSTPHKLSQTPVLFVDTGDKELDAKLRGKIRVITGYRMTTLRDVKGA